MLKGNLVIGKNQSVVLHASSLEDLVRLAETKSRGEIGRGGLGQGKKAHGEITLRVDLKSYEIDWAGVGTIADHQL